MYHLYHGIKQRCYNKNNKKYYLYGGNNIKMCDEWLNNYDSFKEWSYTHGYSEEAKGISIDRINSDGDYEPNNCQWISLSENSAKANYGRKKFNGHREGTVYAENTKSGEIFVVDNITRFAKSIGVSPSTICHKINGRIKNPFLNEWKFYRK